MSVVVNEPKLEKGILGIAGEYSVASEISRRGYYAQVTMGNLKRTDILVYNALNSKGATIEVKSKQDNEWPSVKGFPTGDPHLLVFVDFQHKSINDRPDFYVLSADDWQDYLKNYTMKIPNFERLEKGHIAVYKDGYKGANVKAKEIEQHEERWDKLEAALQ